MSFKDPRILKRQKVHDDKKSSTNLPPPSNTASFSDGFKIPKTKEKVEVRFY